LPAKIEIRASRNRGERMDVISGTVFDKHGNTASFVIRSWRLDKIDFYVSRDTLVRVVARAVTHVSVYTEECW